MNRRQKVAVFGGAVGIAMFTLVALVTQGNIAGAWGGYVGSGAWVTALSFLAMLTLIIVALIKHQGGWSDMQRDHIERKRRRRER